MKNEILWIGAGIAGLILLSGKGQGEQGGSGGSAGSVDIPFSGGLLGGGVVSSTPPTPDQGFVSPTQGFVSNAAATQGAEQNTLLFGGRTYYLPSYEGTKKTISAGAYSGLPAGSTYSYTERTDKGLAQTYYAATNQLYTRGQTLEEKQQAFQAMSSAMGVDALGMSTKKSSSSNIGGSVSDLRSSNTGFTTPVQKSSSSSSVPISVSSTPGYVSGSYQSYSPSSGGTGSSYTYRKK